MTRNRTAHASRPASTLAGALARATAATPDELAVVEGGARLTFADLHARATLFAEHLRSLGVREGQVVTVQLPNWWEAQVVAQATSLLGAVFNPVVSIYRRHELEFIVRQARSRVLVVPGAYRGHDHGQTARSIAGSSAHQPAVVTLRDEEHGPLPGMSPDTAVSSVREDLWVGVDEQDVDRVAYLLYTSGSTAQPKGALHSSRTLMHEARQVADIARLTSSDRVFMPSPITHVTGLAFGGLLPVDLGIAVVMQDRWDPDVAVDLVQAHRCTFSVSATTFLLGLTKAYERRGGASSLEVFICGGAEIGPELVQRAHRVMGTRVVRCYGSTELPTFCVGDPFGDLGEQARIDGRPVLGADHWVEGAAGRSKAGEGELLVQGDELFLGYLDERLDRDAFSGGYFRTGDLVRVDETGACVVVGRIKDIIIRGGENLSAIEIEDQLQLHPAIGDVAVVAMPDEVLGERACAYVVLEPGCELTVADLRAYLADKGVAVQKTPERLEVVPGLPRTASGKVQKYLLRQRIAQTLEEEAAGQRER